MKNQFLIQSEIEKLLIILGTVVKGYVCQIHELGFWTANMPSAQN